MGEFSDISVMGLELPDFVAKSVFVVVVIIATLLVQLKYRLSSPNPVVKA